MADGPGSRFRNAACRYRRLRSAANPAGKVPHQSRMDEQQIAKAVNILTSESYQRLRTRITDKSQIQLKFANARAIQDLSRPPTNLVQKMSQMNNLYGLGRVQE